MQVIFIINVFQGAGKSCKNLKWFMVHNENTPL